MAVTKLGSSKSSGNSLGYSKERAEVESGVNCEPSYVQEQFEATRKMFGKNDGVQVHTVIQSFAPGEVTPQQANEVGRKLAERIGGGHEVYIGTHIDKAHIHNHIIINSVHPETGLKYHSSKETLYKVKETNDELCKEYGLSIASEGKSLRYKENGKLPERYTLAEKALVEKGKDSWKDEIRQAIDQAIEKTSSYQEFVLVMKQKYDIDIKDDRKHVVFVHPDKGNKVRGHRLGDNYTKEGISHEFKRKIKQSVQRRRTNADDERYRDRGKEYILGLKAGRGGRAR